MGGSVAPQAGPWGYVLLPGEKQATQAVKMVVLHADPTWAREEQGNDGLLPARRQPQTRRKNGWPAVQAPALHGPGRLRRLSGTYSH